MCETAKTKKWRPKTKFRNVSTIPCKVITSIPTHVKPPIPQSCFRRTSPTSWFLKWMSHSKMSFKCHFKDHFTLIWILFANLELLQGTGHSRAGDVAALEAVRHLGEDGPGQGRPRRPARDGGQGGREGAAAGTQFNRDTFNLSFSLKNCLRSLFDSVTCVN